MTSARLYRFCGIMLLLGVGVNLIASIWPFIIDTGTGASASDFQDPMRATFYTLNFITFALILIGLPAMYLRQSGGRGDKLGFTGLILYVIGLFLNMATIGYFVSVESLLANKAPEVIDSIYESSFAIFAVGGMLLCLIGSILLGSAFIRSKVYPSIVGVLLIVSSIINVAQIAFQDGTAAAVVNLLFCVSIAIALGSAGLRLASGRNAAGTGAAVSR